MDASALPKGHIIGWVHPTSASSSSKSLSKSAKKNAKRKEKRAQDKVAEVQAPVPDNWDDDEDEDVEGSKDKGAATPAADTGDAAQTPLEFPNKSENTDANDGLVDKLEKLNVK